MIHDPRIGPQKRLSSDSPRLSPIMKYSPEGILIVPEKLQIAGARHGSM